MGWALRRYQVALFFYSDSQVNSFLTELCLILFREQKSSASWKGLVKIHDLGQDSGNTFFFLIKDQRVYILGFAGHMVSFKIVSFCYRQYVNDMCGYVLIKLYLQKQAAVNWT